MTCAELRSRLDAYAQGRLSEVELAAFEQHIAACAACADFLEAAEPQPEQIATLPRSVDPDGELWTGIRSRLAPRDRPGRHSIAIPRWMLAAAAVVLIAGSSSVTAYLLRRPSSRPAASHAAVLSPLEVQYASASADLSVALERARDHLAPATLTVIQRNLAVIDSALAETRRALAGDPGNATLERLVIAAWRQKVDFLRRATALSSET